MSIKRTITTILVALTVVALVAPTAAQAVTVEELLAQLATLQAQLAALQGGTPAGGTVANCAGVTLSRNLRVGMSGSDVKCVQSILNAKGFTVSTSGAGSAGNETTYFGAKTLAAAKLYQQAKGFTPANQVGPLTRQALTADMGSGTPGTPGTPTTPTAGGLTVSLASDTPSSNSVANNSNANFTKVNLTAGSGDVSVSRIYVTRSGLSTNSAVENIKFVDASTGVYYGSIGSLNTDNKAMITFTQNLVIPANTTRSFYIRAGVVSSTTTAPGGNTAALGIASGSDITSNATSVSGSFPATGNQMTFVNLSIGSAQIEEGVATVDTTPDVGDTDVVLGNFKVTAGSTEPITVETITALKAGTVSNSYLSNLELFDVTNNKSLGTVASFNAEGKVAWTNLNLVIGKGNTVRFKVMADIVDGPSLTAKVDMVDGSDVLMTVKGNTYGYYITPTATGSWNGEPTAAQTINSGGFTMSKSSSTPATGKTSAGDDRVLAVFDFDAKGESVKISSTKITATLSGMTYGEVTNVKMYDENGNIVAGPGDLGSGSYVTFTDTYIVPVGVHKYTVKAKLASTVSTGDTIAASIAAASDVTAKGMTSNSTINPSGTPAGNTQTVAAGDLDLKTLSTPSERYIAVGVQDFIWATASLSAVDSGEDVQVTAITVNDDTDTASGSTTGTTAGTLGDPDDVDNAELWADLTTGTSARGDVYETKISNTEQPTGNANDATNTQAFTLTQTITVPKGGEIRVALVADLAAGAASTTAVHTWSFSDSTQNGASTGSTITETATGAGQPMVVSTGGTLTISKDSSSPVSDIVLGGDTSTIAVFRLAANNIEDLDVDDISLTVTNGTAVDTFYFYGSVGSSATQTLLGSSAGSLTPSITLSDGALVIPANSYVKVTVKAKFIAANDAGLTNNTTITANVQKVGDDAVNTTGKASGTEVDSNANTATGNGMDLYQTRPYFSKNASSPSGVLVSGTQTLLAIFDVRASANEDVTFEQADGNKLTVNISAIQTDSDSASNSFVLKDGDGNTLGTSTAVDGATSVTFNFETTSFTVPAGATKTLYVYGNTTDFEDARDTIQMWLDDSTSTNIYWGINGSGSYNDADKIFRGDIYGGALTQPST